MPAHAAVGVDDDLAPGEAGVAEGTADHETPRGVDEVLGVLVEQLRGKRLLDHQLHHRFVEVLVLHVRRVLRRNDDRLDAHGFVAFVLDRDLALAVGAEEVDLAGLAHRGELPRQRVGVHDRRGHQLGRLVAGVAEHQALIAGALLLVEPFAFGDALRDVGRLRLDRREHAAGLVVEAHRRVGVADVFDHAACELAEVDHGLGRDLAGDDDEAGLAQRLAGDAALAIAGRARRRARRRKFDRRPCRDDLR